MTAVLHIGREDTARRSKYPFGDGASLTADSGVVLPRMAFIDAAVYPPGRAPFRLGRVRLTTFTATLEIIDADGSTVATGSFTLGEPPEAVPLFAAGGAPAGVLVADPSGLAALAGWPRGDHVFRDRAGEFVAAVCQPAAGGVLGFKVGDEIVSGEVVLFGENGVVLSSDESAEADGFVIRVDVVGEPLFLRAGCEPVMQDAGETGLVAKQYLRTLRIQVGTATGDPGHDLLPNAVGEVLVIPAAVADGTLPEGYAFADRPALRVPPASGGLKFLFAGAEGGDRK